MTSHDFRIGFHAAIDDEKPESMFSREICIEISAFPVPYIFPLKLKQMIRFCK
jgi:hypothetical protein